MASPRGPALLADTMTMMSAHEDRVCPSCGVLRRPDEYPKNRNGVPQENCKSCLQYRKDTSKAAKAGFASAEEYRAFRAKVKARKRVQAAKERAARRPALTPEQIFRRDLARQMDNSLKLWLKEYTMMSKLIEGAVLTAEWSSSTFAEHLQRQWFNHDDIEPYFLNVTMRSGKRWVGSWPFMCGKAMKPPIPVRPGPYWQ